jgi:hypothetical protein
MKKTVKVATSGEGGFSYRFIERKRKMRGKRKKDDVNDDE